MLVGVWAVCTQEFFKKFLEYIQPGLTQPFLSYYSLDLPKVNKCSEVRTVFVIYRGREGALVAIAPPSQVIPPALIHTNKLRGDRNYGNSQRSMKGFNDKPLGLLISSSFKDSFNVRLLTVLKLVS